jgi:nicotinic acid mononucleotide adenylyltransferase/ADP-ribose pyrophosphatase YjhB (NUDIX family)
MEKIICAFKGFAPNFSQPFAVAKDHGDASMTLISLRDEYEWVASDVPSCTGFIAGDDSSNFRFVDRKEAYGIAEAAGQLNDLGRQRTSRVLQSCDIDFAPSDLFQTVFDKSIEVAKSFAKKSFAVMSLRAKPAEDKDKVVLYDNILTAKHILVYGGAFDPVTTGHKEIIRALLTQMIAIANERFAPIDIDRPLPVALILMVSNNDEKKYTVRAGTRKRMLRTVFQELCRYSDRWAEDDNVVQIVEQPVRTYQFLTETLKLDPSKVTICMGADEWRMLHDFHRWEHSEELLAQFSFIVFGRNDIPLNDRRINRPNDDVENRLRIVNARIPATSSTQARFNLLHNPMYAGTDVPGEALEYIVDHKLYGQVTQEEYDAAEKEAIARANPDNYPSFSVTATTLIVSKGFVLLVRRKYGPYMGYWCFPGGFANPGEDIEEAALREVKEETSITTIDKSEVECVGVYYPKDPRAGIKPDHGAYDVGLAVEIPHIIRAEAADDAKEVQWVAISDAQKMQLAFHHNRILDDFVRKFPGGIKKQPLDRVDQCGFFGGLHL